MKNKKFVLFLSIALLAVVLLYLWLPCYLSSFFEGLPGYNQGVLESKDNGVFLREYKIKGSQIVVPGYYSFPVGEIWLEYPWARGDCSNPVVVTTHNEYSNYWLYIEIRDDKENKIADKFMDSDKIALMTLEGEPFSIRGIGDKNYLFTSFKNMPSKNEMLNIIERTDSSESGFIPQKWTNPKVIGTINLVAK